MRFWRLSAKGESKSEDATDHASVLVRNLVIAVHRYEDQNSGYLIGDGRRCAAFSTLPANVIDVDLVMWKSEKMFTDPHRATTRSKYVFMCRQVGGAANSIEVLCKARDIGHDRVISRARLYSLFNIVGQTMRDRRSNIELQNVLNKPLENVHRSGRAWLSSTRLHEVLH